MKTFIFVLVFLSPPFLKKLLLRWFCQAKIGNHAYIGWFSAIIGNKIVLEEHAELRALSLIKLDGDIYLGAYAVVSNMILIYGTSNFSLGKHGYIGPQSLINVEETVQIGEYSALGARTMIFTHGSFFPHTEGYWVKFAPVTIGNKVWIAAGAFIHPGIEVGEQVFVNSCSVISKDIPAGVAAEGSPAIPITELAKLKRPMTPKKVDVVMWNILTRFSEVILQTQQKLAVKAEPNNYLQFKFKGKDYLIVYVTSNHTEQHYELVGKKPRIIFIVNQENWQAPSHINAAMIFNLDKMQTQLSKDKIHQELWQFMRRYYGLFFEFA